MIQDRNKMRGLSPKSAPTPQPVQKENIMPKEGSKELFDHLNDICTYLQEGFVWHRKAGNEYRKFYARGWGRWNQVESCGDAKSLIKLTKRLQDNLDFAPKINHEFVAKSEEFTINSMEDFKESHNIWIEREEKFITSLNAAIPEMYEIDMQIYNILCSLLAEVQNEIVMVSHLYGRMELSKWDGADIGQVSQELHHYFEHKHKGNRINFNVG